MKIATTLLLVLVAGCAVRSADMYARDTAAVLATKNDAIRSCYDGVLKTTPDAKGTVTIKFDVETADGRITNVAVDSSTAPAPVAQCVTQNLTGLAVTPPDTKKGKGTWVYEFASSGTVTATPQTTTPPPSPSGATDHRTLTMK